MVSGTSSQKVAEAGRRLGLEIAIREFPQGTRTAEDAARAIGVEVGQIVKSLVFLAGDEPLLALVSGANRVGASKLAILAGVADARRADADEVRRLTGFSVGGVPPFGHAQPLRVFCDEDLLQYETVWAAAGTPMTVFAAEPRRLVDACGATVGELREA